MDTRAGAYLCPVSVKRVRMITCTAPVNIAVIKYWGKRDEALILPINDSVSVTLSSEQMHAKTTVMASPNFPRDRLWLNGLEEDMERQGGRMVGCLRAVREQADRVRKEAGGEATPYTYPTNWKVHICSENNFPTAAGLASSAAGYACLVAALGKLYQIKGDLSLLARRGSGSAARSVLGGFVRWRMGGREDGEDSLAEQVRPASHWPDIRVIICVASDAAKKTPSSVGMRNSVKTSELLKYRAEHCVPRRTSEIVKAIEERDFQTFAELTMKDSNQFHAVCQDTYPPCVYMNSTSHAVSSLVHQLNTHFGELVACYTFDAGPNACIFLLEKYVGLLASLLQHFFSPSGENDFFRGEKIDSEPEKLSLASSLTVPKIVGGLKYLIFTRAGDGPQQCKPTDDLLDKNGMPKNSN